MLGRLERAGRLDRAGCHSAASGRRGACNYLVEGMEAAHSARERRQLGAQTAAGGSSGEGPAETKYPAEGQAARAAGAARLVGAVGLGGTRAVGREKACPEEGLGEGLEADPAVAVSGSGCWP
jgi:hypothetical protein